MCKILFPYHDGKYCFEDEIKVTVPYPPYRYSGPAQILDSQPINSAFIHSRIFPFIQPGRVQAETLYLQEKDFNGDDIKTQKLSHSIQ